jgi:Raf kinase inhibitor-like YbhB/YbcL family protein
MRSRLAPWLLAIALASCGSNNRATNDASKGEGSAMDNSTLAKLDLTSPAFENGQPIPVQYTCDGANHSPALQWGDPPSGTLSFALVVDDPDAPNGTFRHWAAYDIPAATRSIAVGQTVGNRAINDFGNSGYGGPCPPKGHGPHHYRFKLYVLDADKLTLPPNAKVEEVEQEAKQHQIAMAEITGTYERK